MVESSLFPDIEGFFEPDRHLSDPQPVQEGIAEQQLRKSFWILSFNRVQFGKYQSQPACLLVLETKFAPEDRNRHRFTQAQISLTFEGQQKSDVILKQFAPEWARGVTVPGVYTSSWTIKSGLSASMPPTPLSIDLLDVQYGHKKNYQIERTASMTGVAKGIPHLKKVLWSLNEAVQEGIPIRPPSLVALVTYKEGTPFKLKFEIEASIGPSVNPRRWFAKPVKPIVLNEEMQLIPPGNEIDSDFTSLDLMTLTRTVLTDDTETVQ